MTEWSEEPEHLQLCWRDVPPGETMLLPSRLDQKAAKRKKKLKRNVRVAQGQETCDFRDFASQHKAAGWPDGNAVSTVHPCVV